MALTTRNKIGTVALAVATLIGAGCGDDDDAAESGTTTTPSEEATTTSAADGAGEEATGDLDQLCALATTLFEQDEFPSADQIRQYQELAPPELQDAVELAGAAVIDNEGDFVATFATFAEDDVEAALGEINTFENENCGLAHDESSLGAGPNEPEAGAAVVEVTASEYTFDIPEGITAGRTSFVLTNAGGGETGDDELCALATTLFEQDEFPSADQIRQYQELAPPELQDAVATAGAAVTEHEGDFVATFAAFAEDDVEIALAEINAYENETCDIGHDEADTVPPVNEPAEAATQVPVVATEYTFEVPEVAAGPTAFVLDNQGQEAHFMVIAQVLQGTLDEALQFEGDPEAEGLVADVGDSGIAAPGGGDPEVANVELEPGNYAMLCFVPGPDGTPHAFMGMAVEFTVS